MRADKKMDESTCVDMYRRVVITDYINQLRVERLMWKAEYFYELGMQSLNNSRIQKFFRISEAYEARAKRIKDGM